MKLAALATMLTLLPYLVLSSAAAIASPDRVAWTSSELSETTDLVAEPAGVAVLMADPSAGSLASLDLRSWDLSELSLCTGAVGAGVWAGTDETRVYAGCDDGTVTWATLSWSSGSGTAASVASQSPASLTASEVTVDVADGPVLGVSVLGDMVYVLTEPADGSNPTLHTVDPSDDIVDGGSGFPTTLGHSGYADLETNGSYLFVLHGGDNMSKLDPSTGNSVTEDTSLGTLDGVDLVTQSSGSAVYGAGGAAVAWYDLSGNDWSLYLDSGDGLSDVDGICLLETDAQLLVADGGAGSFKLFSYDASANTFGDTVEDSWSFPSTSSVVSELVPITGGAVAGSTSGELWVMTGGPWVEISAADPTAAVAGDSVALTFQSDTDGSYQLRVGGNTDDDGTLVSEGDLSADVAVAVSVDVDDSFVEGDNQLRVVVTDSDGQVGHDAVVVSVDNPPDRISLSEDSVGVADSYLHLYATVPAATDITSVRVYLSVTAFDRESWSSGGGPTFDGDDAIVDSDLLFSVTPAEAADLVISPLTNDVTYYLAVRAVDAGGLEGLMSTVVTGTPELTLGVADITGDPGGFCGTPGLASVGLSLLGLGLAGLRRRRTGAGGLGPVLSSGLGLLALVLGGASVPAQASEGSSAGTAGGVDSADSYTAEGGLQQAAVRGNTQLRVGPMTFASGNAIRDVLGDGGHNVLWLETGPSWKGWVQTTIGVGFYRKKGTLLTSSGASSSQDDLLWAVPLTANLALRLDLVDEQILVPYLTGGGDLWLWREQRKDQTDSSSGVGGGKWGYHYGAGVQLLLDGFERDRAGLAYSRLGIKDTYLAAEWRHQDVGLFQDGLDLSNDQVTFGLSLNY